MQGTAETKGKLRIGDDWNAITIIALSQDNPLKAVAEFVENAIDAGARNVTITRGRERGEHYLTVADDGAGVPRDADGVPDFRYVATHICDSMKRRIKTAGGAGVQGEFGIGLLSFWTVGEALSMSSTGADGRVYEMQMAKGKQAYTVRTRPLLGAERGTRLRIKPLLPGIRQLSGEKMQWYLASELRERIRAAGVQVKIVDRQARKEFAVEPRQFSGRLLHHLPVIATPHGEVYVELYLDEANPENCVGLYRNGTRVLSSIADLEAFARSPWTDGRLQGIVDAPFLNLTPATRTGVIQDAALAAFADAAGPLEEQLLGLIEEQRRAQEEQATQDTLRSIQRAFREAMLTLPEEEYDFFEVAGRRANGQGGGATPPENERGIEVAEEASGAERQRRFFEFAGPLHSVRISPAGCTLAVGTSRTLRALARDVSRRRVEEAVEFVWRIVEGGGRIEDVSAEIATFEAPQVPSIVRIALTARQGEITCDTEALVTVTDELLPQPERRASRHGLPGYTLQHAPGQLWRSRYDAEQNVLVVNSGHRDFLYASRVKTLKLRYLVRLYAKEMVRKNFPGLPGDQLLERLIELCLYAEEHLR